MSTNLTELEYTAAQLDALADINAHTINVTGQEVVLNDLKNNIANKEIEFNTRIDNLSNTIINTQNDILTESGNIDVFIDEQTKLYEDMIPLVTHNLTLTLGGNINNFYPIWFSFSFTHLSFLEITRNKNQNTNLFPTQGIIPDSYIYIEGCDYDELTQIPGRFVVRQFNENNNKCMVLPSYNLYSSKIIGGTKGHYAVGISGIYLRGGLSYNFKCNDKSVMDSIRTIFESAVQSNYIVIGTDGLNYHATPISFDDGIEIEWDDRISPDTDTQYQPGVVITADQALMIGGINSGALLTAIQQSIISTGSDAVLLGNLSINRHQHASASNAGDGVAIIVGGRENTTIINAITGYVIETGISIIDTGILSQTVCMLACSSNGINDTALVSGGYVTIGITTIERSIISTVSDTIVTGDLATAVDSHRSVSNGILDVVIHTNGLMLPPGDRLQRSTISTGSNAVFIGVLTSADYLSGVTSNGINDTAILHGGTNSNNVIQRIIISTGTDSINTGVLQLTRYAQSSTSNGSADTAIHTGGNLDNGTYSSDIQQSVISSGADSITIGILIITSAKHSATSNA